MTNEERAIKIRELMAAHECVVSELAKASGVHRNTIYKILKGKTGCSTNTLTALANALGISIKTLA